MESPYFFDSPQLLIHIFLALIKLLFLLEIKKKNRVKLKKSAYYTKA